MIRDKQMKECLKKTSSGINTNSMVRNAILGNSVIGGFNDSALPRGGSPEKKLPNPFIGKLPKQKY